MTESAANLPGRIAIVGLGLIGGSIARALRALPGRLDILASSLDIADLERAVAEGVVQDAGTPERIVGGADLVVYATPPDATIDYLDRHAALWRAGAVVTDVGSVKRQLAARVAELGLQKRFVGSHPMAGDHRAGYAAARADLFVGARVWVTPIGLDNESAVAVVEALWRAVGANAVRIDADRHDRLVAWTSHLPQVAVTALATALARSGYGAEALGPGGRDATRLAGSPAALWEEILLANADLLEDPLTALEGALARIAEAIRSRDPAAIRKMFENAAQWRGS